MSARSVLLTAPAPKATMPSSSLKPSLFAASTLDGWRPETTSGPWSGRLARVRACTGVFASAAAAWRALCTKSIFGSLRV